MEDNFPYKVVEAAGDKFGRAAVASRALQPGQIVLAERALACVAVTGRSLCDDCLESVREGTQCDGCRKEVGYSAVQPRASLPVRLAAKLISKQCGGLLREDQALAMESLMHHDHQQESDVFEVVKLATIQGKCAADSIETNIQVLSNCFGEYGGASAVLRRVNEELGRVSVNAINTCDGDGATGLGLFLSAAMFNHSCCPNVQAWWRGTKLELRSTKPVAAGEELCISYIRIDQPSTIRRALLRSNWFFTCHCTRCVSGQWDTEITGFRCPSAGCSGAVPPPGSGIRPECNHCGRLLTGILEGKGCHLDAKHESSTPPSIASAETCSEQPSLSKRLLDAQRNFETGVEAYMCEDPETALSQLEKCLASREGILHAFNNDLLRTLRYASYASVATHSWSKAYLYLVRWLQAMNEMFGVAEVWDIALIHVDIGLVLDKLGVSRTPIPKTEAYNLSQSETSRQRRANDIHPAALAHIKEGLRWIWICLGKDTGLPAEITALEVCSKYDISF